MKVFGFIPPHKHEWDYTGSEVSDMDCLTVLYHEYECWNCKKIKRVDPEHSAREYMENLRLERLLW
jgi:hypothetical protein